MLSMFILVILTAAPGGELSAAFVTTETKAECEARSEAIRGILKAGKIDIKEFACLKSEQRFEKFMHAEPTDAPRYSYSIRLEAETAKVAAQPSQQACETSLREARPSNGLRDYCATSTQKLLPTSSD